MTEDDASLFIKTHYQKIVTLKKFCNSQLIFIPENNLGKLPFIQSLTLILHYFLGNEATLLSSIVEHIANLNIKTYSEKNRIGVQYTIRVAREYQFLTSLLLTERNILFDTDIFTTTHGQTAQDMLETLQDQMTYYHWGERIPNTNSYELIGKEENNLFKALEMVLYWGRIIVKEDNK